MTEVQAIKGEGQGLSKRTLCTSSPMKTDGSWPICSSFLKCLKSQIKPRVEPIELCSENKSKLKETNPTHNQTQTKTTPRTPPKLHHFMLRSLCTAIQWQCPGRFLLTRPRPPDLPCSSLKRVLSSFSISARCSSRVSLPAGMAAAARPALPPRRDSQCGEGEASPAVREHRQNPRVSADPGTTRPLRSASRRRPRLHVPRCRGSAETRHRRAGRRGAGTGRAGYGTSCQAAPSPAPAGDRRRSTPEQLPSHSAARPAARAAGVPPGGEA